ncbi:cell wall hydrolase [Halobacillus rhizosphaerae]|uniref:cell wall hydrolase n=1 Tax=Halobacillus rhizosphaerae TaxID=3064889 RepID=UPI00398A714A
MLKRLVIASLAIISSLTFGIQAHAESNQTYTVQQGDSFYDIAQKYGISAQQLKAMNDKNGNMIYPGQTLKLPVAPTASEKNLLARLVEAEAKGESYAGKVAVATVVLNRVQSDQFPDSLYGVIYDNYQFSPVLNGTIHQPASSQSKQAVREAIAYQGYDHDSLFFYNPKKASSDYLSNRQVTTVIGNHVFMK